MARMVQGMTHGLMTRMVQDMTGLGGVFQFDPSSCRPGVCVCVRERECVCVYGKALLAWTDDDVTPGPVALLYV